VNMNNSFEMHTTFAELADIARGIAELGRIGAESAASITRDRLVTTSSSEP
jgi:hypothetical protein